MHIRNMTSKQNLRSRYIENFQKLEIPISRILPDEEFKLLTFCQLSGSTKSKLRFSHTDHFLKTFFSYSADLETYIISGISIRNTSYKECLLYGERKCIRP